MSVPCSGFDNSVQAIATYYRTFTTFNPPLSSLLRSTEFHKIFWNSLEHDLFVVRQRSQDLAEHEITIIQKALVLLMNNSEDQISAANLYADEILGVVYLPATAKSDALETAVRARALALECMCKIQHSLLEVSLTSSAVSTSNPWPRRTISCFDGCDLSHEHISLKPRDARRNDSPRR